MSDAECVRACMRQQQARYAFLSNGKLYQLANQDAPGLDGAADMPVRLTGLLNNGTITISRIVLQSDPPVTFLAGGLERVSRGAMELVLSRFVPPGGSPSNEARARPQCSSRLGGA